MTKRESFLDSSATSQIVIGQYGDASALTAIKATLPPPGTGEIRVRHTAIGVNYVDIYHRTPGLPQLRICR